MRAAILITLLAGLAAGTTASAGNRFDLPEGPGRSLVYGNCQTCHDLQSLVDSAGIGRGSWDAVLDSMREFGLRIDDQQRAQILEYLATYLGPNPPPPAKDTAVAANADGAETFADVCAACHQPDGKGKEKEFPPLAGNHDIFLSQDFPVKVVLHGITGPLEVNGKKYDNTMPSFDFLEDGQIAAVINYVRGNWDNPSLAPDGMAPVTPEEIAQHRQTKMSDTEVHALRKSLMK